MAAFKNAAVVWELLQWLKGGFSIILYFPIIPLFIYFFLSLISISILIPTSFLWFLLEGRREMCVQLQVLAWKHERECFLFADKKSILLRAILNYRQFILLTSWHRYTVVLIRPSLVHLCMSVCTCACLFVCLHIPSFLLYFGETNLNSELSFLQKNSVSSLQKLSLIWWIFY